MGSGRDQLTLLFLAQGQAQVPSEVSERIAQIFTEEQFPYVSAEMELV